MQVGGVAVGLGTSGEGLLGSLNLLRRRVELLELAALAREQDQARLVLLEASHVRSKRLLRDVSAAVVNGDADGGRQLARNAGLLQQRADVSHGLNRPVF